jgi:flavin-dependent dehydrogenase
VLVDQHPFPRDKVCGDGLIPDAHNALAKLGVLDSVLALAQSATHVGCVGPRGGRIDVPGTLAVLPRKELDLVLCRAAAAAGARMHAPVRFESRSRKAAASSGATLEADDASHVRAGHVGRAGHRRRAAGADGRRHVDRATRPAASRLRGYVKNPRMAGASTSSRSCGTAR